MVRWGRSAAALMGVRIIGANLRDMTYIVANLRHEDKEEIACQLDEWNGTMIAALSIGEHSYVATVNGNPEAAFGASYARQGYWIAWAWGTRHMLRTVPRMSKFIQAVLIPDLYALGAHRVEARSISTHTQAHRWLEGLGAHRRCDLPGYGKDGEDFVLYDWTRSHVHQSLAKDPQAQEAATNSTA